ncbi:MAG: lipase [Planctomycetota bacterium]
MALRIAAIGDSLTQGFMSGAISKTAQSYPALIARATGGQVPRDFRVPNFPGFGLPLNLEEYLRFCEHRLGTDISGKRDWLIRFPSLYQEFADRVEDLYERGAGSRPAPFGGVYHNLAIWGFRVFDSFMVDSNVCRAAINDQEGWIQDDFLGLPSAAMYRTAYRVLNPRQRKNRDDVTQISAIGDLLDQEGLDVITLALGANDCLGTVLSLEVKEMGSRVTKDPIKRTNQYNLTSKKQFQADYDEMAKRLSTIIKRHPKSEQPKVFVGTVPKVTIPPITRGIGEYSNGYFDYYSRFFLQEDSFSPKHHSHLTRAQAVMIDQRIDDFNATIRSVAQKQGWHVVDTSAALCKLAVRRNNNDRHPRRSLVNYFAHFNITDHPLLNIDPAPSILRLETNEGGKRTAGGLFSLDCVHPTSCLYGLMAELFLREMAKQGVEGADPQALNWQEIIAQDSLLRRAPATWDDIIDAAQANPWLWDTLFSAMG